MKIPDNPDVLVTTATSGHIYLLESFTVKNKRFAEFLGDLIMLYPDGSTKGKAYPVKWEAL